MEEKTIDISVNEHRVGEENRDNFFSRMGEETIDISVNGHRAGEEKGAEKCCRMDGKTIDISINGQSKGKQKQTESGIELVLLAEKTIDISVTEHSIDQGCASASTSQPEMSITESSKEVMDALRRTVTQKAFSYSAHLANLLPTGTLLAFQVLLPIFSNDGDCNDGRRYMTAGLLIGIGLACFMVSFTDSFKGSDGKIYYGLTTPKGLWTFQYVTVAVPDSGQYKLSVVDFVHAIMSLLVFITVALFNENVVKCFWPHQNEDAKQVLRTLPIGIGFFASVLFVVFPTTRHGIGYPVTT
ncbi:hypothetical protein SUGI_1072250 [Cryptomeria japonica]|uniref:protein DMP4-like n=1 Tax=Cryptomeria japonica TaxID=3369 RepID=UPI002414B962|nr:protein DMP4-like [Cryptomeria japonica]GLJ50333.1 hypothetical protein SUGI_1072250 [Cryptomeria japonica]